VFPSGLIPRYTFCVWILLQPDMAINAEHVSFYNLLCKSLRNVPSVHWALSSELRLYGLEKEGRYEMPGGKYDSSKTRVRPVFDALWATGRDWLPQMLALPIGGCASAETKTGDWTLIEGHWEPHEKCLNPPVSLLSWLIRNVDSLASNALDSESRRHLATGDPETVDHALRLLRTENASRGWYIFEGPTCPDVYLIARDALVIVEGKRTEKTTTTDTKWLRGRHQIWRHIDAAWEIRGRRAVYGFFIVESDDSSTDGSVPRAWRDDTQTCFDPQVLRTSLPHRSEQEAAAISHCYLGATTWRKVCMQFHIDWRTLPHEISKPDI
jgi:hypothetical protein